MTEVSSTVGYQAPELDADFDIFENILVDETALQIAGLNELLASPSYTGGRNYASLKPEKATNAHDSINEEFEDDYIYERPKTRLGRISATIGLAAIRGRLAVTDKLGEITERGVRKQAARETKFAASDDDNRRESIYKSIRRNQNTIIGRAALAGAFAAEAGLLYLRLRGVGYTPPLLRFYSVNDTALSTKYIFGGRGDPTGQGVIDGMQATGQMKPDTNYIGVNYSATMGIIDNNGPTLDRATSDGASAAYQQFQQVNNSGAQFYDEGFSEGSVAALKFAQQVQADNGGVLPSNFHLVLNGSPVTSTGFYNGGIAQSIFIKPFLDVAGISPDTGAVPPGTIANSSQNDLWGNGAHQSLLGNGLQTLDMQYAHVVEDPNAPHITWTDSAGVIHNNYDVGLNPLSQQVIGNGGYMNDGYNNFFNDIVPINNGRDGLPQPNAAHAEMDLASGIDQQTGGTGIPQKVMAAIPQPMTNVIQNGLNLVNNDPNLLMDATQNPANAPQDIQAVMNDVSNTINSVRQALPGNGNTPVKDFINGVVHNVAPQISAPVNNVIYSAPAPAPAPAYVPAPDFVPAAPIAAPAPMPLLDNLFNGGGNQPAPVRDIINNILHPRP